VEGIGPTVISLNLVYDYPVRWSRFKVLRDFVQNFYDSVTWQGWDKRFSWRIANGQLEMTAKDIDFSYDWLIHIGASTKRDDDQIHAGYFGEGFKIASLCAVRDFGWSVRMISREWDLQVIKTDLLVDSKQLAGLGYSITKSTQPNTDTTLKIAQFNQKELMECVLLSFYSPANPLLGKMIFESTDVAVYHRSNMIKPRSFPQTCSDEGPGIIFAGYQALGSFKDRLVFCLHRYQCNDRERNNFFQMDVVNTISKSVQLVSCEAAALVLRQLRSRWYERPHKKYDFESWSGIIENLVIKISQSSAETQKFTLEYPDLLVAAVVKRSNILAFNRRRQSLDWLKNNPRPYRLVQQAFNRLGYQSLEEACDQAGGFSILRAPDSMEQASFALIEKLATTVFPSLYKIAGIPPIVMIKNEKSAWLGMANCLPVKERAYFNGWPIQFRLTYIAFKRSLVHRDRFGAALGTYMHEIAHVFGGDHSASYSYGLTTLMENLLDKVQLIADCQRQWEQLTSQMDEQDVRDQGDELYKNS
jgi:hypothetical protein